MRAFAPLLLAVLFTSVALAADPSVPVPVPDRLRNPWPAEWEKEFQARGERVLKGVCAKEKAAGLGGRTYFESEKRAYGYLMAHAAAGEKDVAVKELQKEDAQAKQWHAHTAGIDYYACFTLKHQVRKYFLFGDRFDPKYKQRMFDGAKAWTEKDPLRRPHPAFVKAGDGWGPDVKNSWVDVRGTENLFLMRVTSVYLMAEETGNEATRKQYKETILKYAAALYRVGMGEWDSENYHGHSIAPLLNLFDFSRDDEVKAAAKLCLDYMCAVGAVKYYRGAFNGPTNRDYSHPQPFGGSAPCMLWLYFGDTPLDNTAYSYSRSWSIGRSGPAFLVVALPSAVLVAAAPGRPRQHPVGVRDERPHQLEQQFPHLRHAQPDQPRVPFFRRGAGSRERITATTARAHRLNVTCRCQPVQLRTSYSSSPQSPFASSNRSSIAQRAPATRTSC
jgi:hypothetical protein